MVAARTKHIPSVLLTEDENTFVLKILGQKRYSVATAVAEVYMALPNNRTQWTKQYIGVVCLVKDGVAKSFFIRLINMEQQAIVWEQELYKQFKYRQATSSFHTFNGDDCRVGINFCNEPEAAAFRAVVKERIREFRRKREETRMKKMKQQQMMMMSGTVIPHPSGRGFIRVHNISNIGPQNSRGKMQLAGPRGPPMMGGVNRQRSMMMRSPMSGIMPQMSGMHVGRSGRGGLRPSISMMRYGPPFPRRPMMRPGPPPNWGYQARGPPPPRYHPGYFQPGQHPSGQLPPGYPPPGQYPMGQHPSGHYYPGQPPAGHPSPGQVPRRFAHSQGPMPQESRSKQEMPHRPSSPFPQKEVKVDNSQREYQGYDKQASDERKRKKGFFSKFKKTKANAQEPATVRGMKTRAETGIEQKQTRKDSVPVPIQPDYAGSDMIVGVADQSGEIYNAADYETFLAEMPQKQGASADEFYPSNVAVEPRTQSQAPPPPPVQTTAPSACATEEVFTCAPPPPPPPPPPPLVASLPSSEFVRQTASPAPSIQSGGLMESILAGKQLKKVDRSSTPPPSSEMAGMGSALARALDERSKVMHSSDEDDFEDDEDWDDDDDDEWSD